MYEIFELANHPFSSEPNPADLTTICGVNAGNVQSDLTSTCQSASQVAVDYFASTCQERGLQVGKLFSFFAHIHFFFFIYLKPFLLIHLTSRCGLFS